MHKKSDKYALNQVGGMLAGRKWQADDGELPDVRCPGIDRQVGTDCQPAPQEAKLSAPLVLLVPAGNPFKEPSIAT
jgi:hypothetical protein